MPAEFVGLLVILGGRDDDPTFAAQGCDGGHAAARGRHVLEDAGGGAPAEAAVEDDDDGAGVGRAEAFGELVHWDRGVREGVEPGVLGGELVGRRPCPAKKNSAVSSEPAAPSVSSTPP